MRAAVASGVLPKAAATIACDDCCQFGQWLAGLMIAPEVRAMPQFDPMVAAQTAFHKEAGRIAAMIEAGLGTAAQAALEEDRYAGASEALKRATIAWQRAL